MNVGQKVRVRPSSEVSNAWRIPREAPGTVICRYRVLKEDQAAPERLDVRFGQKLVEWGAPDREFEPL